MCYSELKGIFDNCIYTKTIPMQIILKFPTCTMLLFNSGNLRIMGKASYANASFILSCISFIYSDITTSLSCVSQTVVFQVPTLLCPIPLYTFKNAFPNELAVQYEPELFTALSIKYWKPIHVNLFSTGKVVVLGKDALKYKSDIDEWLTIHLMLYT